MVGLNAHGLVRNKVGDSRPEVSSSSSGEPGGGKQVAVASLSSCCCDALSALLFHVIWS